MQLRIQYGDDQVMPISNYQMLYHGHRCHQTPEGCFLKEQSSFPINGLPHNPVINKRIIVTGHVSVYKNNSIQLFNMGFSHCLLMPFKT